jgi:hypothetical protein
MHFYHLIYFDGAASSNTTLTYTLIYSGSMLKFGTNFADKRRSLGLYSLLAD